MRAVPTWPEYHMGLAYEATKRSKDPSTNVGCVIVNDDHHSLVTGYNGFGKRVKETSKRWERPQKYRRVIHAEMNAIGLAAREGISLKGCHLYCTHFPCLECAKLISTAGIVSVRADNLMDNWGDSQVHAAAHFFETEIGWMLGTNQRNTEQERDFAEAVLGFIEQEDCY